MSDLICFVINENGLYLDKILASFNDIPIFFVCKDSNDKYYLVLCLDVSEFNYLVFEVEFNVLHEMLKKQITMRDAIMTANSFYDVQTGDNAFNDTVRKFPIKNINKNILPLKGTFVNL